MQYLCRTMYSNTKLQVRMAERKLNYNRLSKLTGLDHKTVKKVIADGKGAPESWDAIAKALGFRRGVKDIVQQPACCQYSDNTAAKHITRKARHGGLPK
jgi:hypothetical protein